MFADEAERSLHDKSIWGKRSYIFHLLTLMHSWMRTSYSRCHSELTSPERTGVHCRG